MQILTDKVLAAAGVDFRTAVSLLNPAEDELVVHVRQELDAPPLAQDTSMDIDAQPSTPGISLRVIADAPTDCSSVEADSPVHSGDQGYTLGGLRLLAEQQRLSLVYTGGTGGAYVLSGAFGQRFYSSLSQVAGALKYGRW